MGTISFQRSDQGSFFKSKGDSVLTQSNLRSSGPLAENMVMVFQCCIGPLHHHSHLYLAQIWLTISFQRSDRGSFFKSKADRVLVVLDPHNSGPLAENMVMVF